MVRVSQAVSGYADPLPFRASPPGTTRTPGITRTTTSVTRHPEGPEAPGLPDNSLLVGVLLIELVGVGDALAMGLGTVDTRRVGEMPPHLLGTLRAGFPHGTVVG